MHKIRFSREWEMPDSNTFNIRCIQRLIGRYWTPDFVSIDPFANSSKLASITNDLNPEYKTTYNLDALEFLKIFDDKSVDFVFYDPPYSLRQISECYKGVGMEVTNEITQSSWRTKQMNEIARILKPDGVAMCFGWNSSGVGIKRGFSLLEVMIIAHGGMHNDTICTVEKKNKTLFDL